MISQNATRQLVNSWWKRQRKQKAELEEAERWYRLTLDFLKFCIANNCSKNIKTNRTLLSGISYFYFFLCKSIDTNVEMRWFVIKTDMVYPKLYVKKLIQLYCTQRWNGQALLQFQLKTTFRCHSIYSPYRSGHNNFVNPRKWNLIIKGKIVSTDYSWTETAKRNLWEFLD